MEKQIREFNETHNKMPSALNQINEIESNLRNFALQID